MRRFSPQNELHFAAIGLRRKTPLRRKRNLEPAAVGLDGQIPDVAAVQPGDPADYRKAKPRAASLHRTRTVYTVKPLEYPRRLVQRNSDAVILDRQPDALRVRAADDRDLLRP